MLDPGPPQKKSIPWYRLGILSKFTWTPERGPGPCGEVSSGNEGVFVALESPTLSGGASPQKDAPPAAQLSFLWGCSAKLVCGK